MTASTRFASILWLFGESTEEVPRRPRCPNPRTAPRGSLEQGDFQVPHESPGSMTWPLLLLAVGAFCAGYLWVGIAHFEPFVQWLRPALGDIGVEPSRVAVNKPLSEALSPRSSYRFGVGLVWKTRG